MAADARRSTPGEKGELIRTLRINRSLRQEDVAMSAGISIKHLSLIESGQIDPNPDTIERLALALGVTAAYLDVKALADVLTDEATNPEVRSYVERIVRLHDAVATMSVEERERLYQMLDAEPPRGAK